MRKIYRIMFALAMMLTVSQSTVLSQDQYNIAPSDFTGDISYSVLTDSIEAIITERTDAGQDMNVEFILSNGGLYFVTRPLTNDGFHLRLSAEDPDGAKPSILLQQNEAGDWPNMLDLLDDATFTNVHINSMKGSLTSNYDSNKNGIKGDNSRIVFKGCYLERFKRGLAYINAVNTSVFFYDCRIGNLGETHRVKGFGDLIDCRAAETDTVVIQNCTMYDINYHVVRTSGNHIKYFKFDHNTGVNWYSRVEAPFTFGTVGEAFITNNIAKDPDYFGSSDAWNYWYNDTVDQSSYVMMDTAYYVADGTEAQFTVRNNNFFYDDELLNFFNTRSIASKPGEIAANILPVLQGDPGEAFIEEQVNFTNMPSVLVGLQDSIYLTDDPLDANGAPELYPHDTLIFIPNIDASYPDAAISYSAADDGFPLGDLNWFPENKARWEAGESPVGIEDVKAYALEDAFSLYPNPAGAETTLHYTMSEAGESQIMIYDLNGRLLKLAEQEYRHAGTYRSTISLTDLESGAYLVVHKTGYGVHHATYLIKE
ncbi:MAG: T9SS type A sorting domain-containing protein [Bacteroidetes bacterium]|nr:T9SS type A sorting domain-containing protein [Bacteroidota bacterium]